MSQQFAQGRLGALGPAPLTSGTQTRIPLAQEQAVNWFHWELDPGPSRREADLMTSGMDPRTETTDVSLTSVLTLASLRF